MVCHLFEIKGSSIIPLLLDKLGLAGYKRATRDRSEGEEGIFKGSPIGVETEGIVFKFKKK